MANQPEITSYDSGVYQIETTDPVDGGVGAITNAPLLALANRTNYLKKHLDDIESGNVIPSGLAPLNSPSLTGSPTAPTQAAGDSSTKLANTAFVQGAVNGSVSVSVAGGGTTTLTAAQYGVAIIVLTGAITANKAVVFPALSGHWQVVNNTTGAFTITLKTAAGAGVVVTQGTSTCVFGNGTDIGLQQTDFISPAMTGVPTAPQAAQFSSIMGQVATVGFLKLRGVEYRNVFTFTSSTTLNALHTGSIVVLAGPGATTLTLPPANSVAVGASITIQNYQSMSATWSVACQGTDAFIGVLNGTATSTSSFTMFFGDTITLTSDGGSSWCASSNSSANFVAAQFLKGQSLNPYGYQKYPGGLIEQWGSIITSSAGTATISFPTAFAVAAFSGQLTVASAGVWYACDFDTDLSTSKTSVTIRMNAAVSQLVYYRIIGK